jgi:hypothetical protein
MPGEGGWELFESRQQQEEERRLIHTDGDLGQMIMVSTSRWGVSGAEERRPEKHQPPPTTTTTLKGSNRGKRAPYKGLIKHG